MRAVEPLAEYGWTSSGWFAGGGSLVEEASQRLASVHSAERPLAYSGGGWREPPGWRRRLLATPGYLRQVREALVRVRPHVVHANTLLSLPEAAVARSCGLPVVLQVHEIPDAGPKRTGALRAAAHVADVLVGVSDAVADILRQRAGGTPVLTVRNGVPRQATRTPRRGRPFTVGNVGTVSRVKGTDLYVRASRLVLDQRPETTFEHLGAPGLHRDLGLDAELDRLLGDGYAAPPVQMLGSRPAETRLSDWDVYVSSSRSEAFPLAVLEAMAAGLPVIATAVGGVPEQIEHLETGILVPCDRPEAIATWILRLQDDPELRRRLGAAAARRVKSEFTLGRQAEGLHRAYLTALNLRFAPPVVRARMLATDA